jgi:O-succinylbenzoate synthase
MLPFRLALRVPFRGLSVRRGCLIEGDQGWGEFAPFDDYSDEAGARWLHCAREQAERCWPEPVRDAVEVNAIVPAVTPGVAARMAISSGCRTIKIKVGDAAGFARVAAVREALPDARLRVDVNGGWTLAQAIDALIALRPLGLEYAEQPVRSFEDMARLRSAVDVPLAADELIRIDRRFEDVRDAADVAVLKVAPLGGVRATLDVAARVGLPVVISSALDSSMGLAASVAAACALPVEPLACGLGTGLLFAQDTTSPLVPVDGRIGCVGYPDPGGFEPAWEDQEYWRARMASVVSGRGT